MFVLVGCNKDDSDIPKVTVFELTTESNLAVEDIYIYCFNHLGELKTDIYYPTDLESTSLDLDGGSYTFVVVANVGDDFMPPATNGTNVKTDELFDFISWLNEIKAEHDDMLTAMTQAVVKDNGTSVIVLELKEGSEGLIFNTLRLNLTLPNSAGQDANIIQDYNLRATVEVYQKGSDNYFYSYSTILSGQSFDLKLQAGDYDILLWTDYVTKLDRTDYYYTTSQLKDIKFNEAIAYTGSTDSRDAYSLAFEASIEDQEITEKSITLERAFTKYRILATDVELYHIFERINDYPPMEDLTVSISYDGDLPNSYDVTTNKAIDVIEGLKYRSSVEAVSDTTAIIGSDYIFVSEAETVVFVTIKISDKNGNKIAEIPNVKIDYRRNQLTTISGDFLTAGIVTSDVNITVNTDWENENDHEFE